MKALQCHGPDQRDDVPYLTIVHETGPGAVVAIGAVGPQRLSNSPAPLSVTGILKVILTRAS